MNESEWIQFGVYAGVAFASSFLGALISWLNLRNKRDVELLACKRELGVQMDLAKRRKKDVDQFSQSLERVKEERQRLEEGLFERDDKIGKLSDQVSRLKKKTTRQLQELVDIRVERSDLRNKFKLQSNRLREQDEQIAELTRQNAVLLKEIEHPTGFRTNPTMKKRDKNGRFSKTS